MQGASGAGGEDAVEAVEAHKANIDQDLAGPLSQEVSNPTSRLQTQPD